MVKKVCTKRYGTHLEKQSKSLENQQPQQQSPLVSIFFCVCVFNIKTVLSQHNLIVDFTNGLELGLYLELFFFSYNKSHQMVGTVLLSVIIPTKKADGKLPELWAFG